MFVFLYYNCGRRSWYGIGKEEMAMVMVMGMGMRMRMGMVAEVVKVK